MCALQKKSTKSHRTSHAIQCTFPALSPQLTYIASMPTGKVERFVRADSEKHGSVFHLRFLCDFDIESCPLRLPLPSRGVVDFMLIRPGGAALPFFALPSAASQSSSVPLISNRESSLAVSHCWPLAAFSSFICSKLSRAPCSSSPLSSSSSGRICAVASSAARGPGRSIAATRSRSDCSTATILRMTLLKRASSWLTGRSSSFSIASKLFACRPTPRRIAACTEESGVSSRPVKRSCASCGTKSIIRWWSTIERAYELSRFRSYGPSIYSSCSSGGDTDSAGCSSGSSSERARLHGISLSERASSAASLRLKSLTYCGSQSAAVLVGSSLRLSSSARSTTAECSPVTSFFVWRT
mmetsp:Transcript_31677/g.66665  ORF Transcript_31677/g.66665 Transcript_31677/m.66665 type:complete len:355 (+) Transcript_31677:375-1439(+)